MSGVYIISAPSGSGKSTLVNRVRLIVPGLKFSISYTTRAPRAGEENGREYYFVSRAEFEEMIRQDAFLEYAEVFGTTMARRAASCSRPKKKEKTCCWTSMFRARRRSSGKSRGQSVSSSCLPTVRNWRSGCAPAVWMRNR